MKNLPANPTVVIIKSSNSASVWSSAPRRMSIRNCTICIAAKGKTRLVGLVSGGWPQTAEVAVVFCKGKGLVEPVTHILNDRIADGTYQKVLIRWKFAGEAITQSRTSPPDLSKDIFRQQAAGNKNLDGMACRSLLSLCRGRRS